MTSNKARTLGWWCMGAMAVALVLLPFVPELALVVGALASGLGVAAFQLMPLECENATVPVQTSEQTATR